MSSRFEISATPLDGVRVLRRLPVGDERGFLERLFCTDDLRDVLGARAVAQVNRTRTEKRGTVRGLHFQRPPHAELKLVSCLRGAVYDVAVDVRAGSPTFLRWHSEVLSDENHRTMVIPEGFAHGFQALSDDVELLYVHTAAYAPGAEGGLNAHDERLAIPWPEPVAEQSARDRALPKVSDGFGGIAL